jgi:tetratricopeptide (TPR) repeat protein
MSRMIVRGVLALAFAATGLMAQPKPKSQPEVDALRAMFDAATPDARIAAAENVLTKFADTEFKPVALYFEAASYADKGDYEHAVVFGERTVEADPKHYQAMILLAREIAQHTKEFDLDRDEKLAKVDKYCKTALELLPTAPKPNPSLPDEQWANAKKDFEAQIHETLGIAAMDRKQPEVAATEFKTSLDTAAKPDAAVLVRLGMAYRDAGKYDDAIAQFDKVMAMPDVNAQVKQVAQAERVRAIQKKNGGKPPAPAAAAPAPGAATPAAPVTPPPQKP